jgi:uncharacterized protein (TIGR03435 family)
MRGNESILLINRRLRDLNGKELKPRRNFPRRSLAATVDYKLKTVPAGSLAGRCHNLRKPSPLVNTWNIPCWAERESCESQAIIAIIKSVLRWKSGNMLRTKRGLSSSIENAPGPAGRIGEIMTLAQTSYRPLVASIALVLTGFAVVYQSRAQSPAARPEFEVASVKPNTSANNMIMIRPPVGGRFTATNVRLKMLIGLAYKLHDYEISGGPAWISSDGYDITAKAADSNIGIDQLRPMLQALLEDRFQLKAHRETKEVPVYALVVTGKNGPRLPEAKEGGCTAFNPASGPPPPPKPGQFPPTPCGGFFMGPNHLEGGKVGMQQLVDALSSLLGRPVIDKTGFKGTFDVKLDFSPDGTSLVGRGGFGPRGEQAEAGTADNAPPSLFTAIQDELGLKLESQKGPGEMLVIDHAEKASEN